MRIFLLLQYRCHVYTPHQSFCCVTSFVCPIVLIRRLFNISPRTHSKYLPLICEDLPIDVQIYKRFIKFFDNVINSDNECVTLCGKLALNGSNSSVCNNLSLISHVFKCNRYEIGSRKLSQNKYISNFMGEYYSLRELQVVGSIRDLLYIRDIKCTQFNENELNHLLWFMCTNE